MFATMAGFNPPPEEAAGGAVRRGGGRILVSRRGADTSSAATGWIYEALMWVVPGGKILVSGRGAGTSGTASCALPLDFPEWFAGGGGVFVSGAETGRSGLDCDIREAGWVAGRAGDSVAGSPFTCSVMSAGGVFFFGSLPRRRLGSICDKVAICSARLFARTSFQLPLFFSRYSGSFNLSDLNTMIRVAGSDGSAAAFLYFRFFVGGPSSASTASELEFVTVAVFADCSTIRSKC